MRVLRWMPRFARLHRTRLSAGGMFAQPMRTSSAAASTSDDQDEPGDIEEMPFPRIGWTPGSFGTRALRKSIKRKPGEPTGRTAPKRAEEDFWLEAYEAYGVEPSKSRDDEAHDAKKE